MENTFTQMAALLITSAGTVIFYLMMIVMIAASVQIVLNTPEGTLKLYWRLWLAFIVFLVGLAAVFTLNSLGGQNWLNSRAVLPPLERSLMFFFTVWLMWLWLARRKNQLADLVFLLLNLVWASALVLSLFQWQSQYSLFYFNLSELDWYWGLASLALTLSVSVLIPFVRPRNWHMPLTAALVLIAGYSIHLFWLPSESDFSGVLRLTYIVIFALLPSLTSQFMEHASKGSEQQAAGSDSKSVFNQKLKLLSESNAEVFQKSIPAIMIELAGADGAFYASNSLGGPEVIIQLTNQKDNEQRTFVIQPEDIPHLAHAVESQFLLSFDNVPGFYNEFRQLGKKLNIFNAQSALALPYPLQPEIRQSLVLVSSKPGVWNEVSQAELSSAAHSMLLIYHQKQRESQLQRSVQRLIESKQPDFRSISSFSYQTLQQDYNKLVEQHDDLTERYRHLQNDLVTLSSNLSVQESRGRGKGEQSANILKAWLDQAHTQNGLLQAELEQLLREKQSLELEVDHFRETTQLAGHYAYLRPQETLPLDEQTNLNETLARAQELLFKITEMNRILEQNQVQSVILLESIQEQVNNLHQLRLNDQPTEGESFLTQAEYFLEDIRTAQSVLKEQTRLQKMLEETFLNSLKMKDHCDHLVQINHRNYKKVNQIYTELETNRNLNQEAQLILTNIQEENEKLRQRMVEALDKNRGDTLTIENLQNEMLSALEEIGVLKDKIDQKQDLVYHLQMQNELIVEGMKENNQLITSLLQDVLQPISTINGCANLLANQFKDDDISQKFIDQIYASLRSIQEQVGKLIACTDRNIQLLAQPEGIGMIQKNRPPAPPEILEKK